jgi:hypothetical protein
VDAGRSVVVVEIPSATTPHHTIQLAPRMRLEPSSYALGHRCEPFVSVEAAPRGVARQRHRQRAIHRSEVPRPAPSGGRCPERGCTRIVGAGQSAAKFVGGSLIGFHCVQPFKGQAGGVVSEHSDAGHTRFRGRQPGQSGGLTREEPAGSVPVPLDERFHHSCGYGCPETLRKTRSRARVGKFVISAT